MLEADLELKTSDGYGLHWPNESAKWDRPSSGWRMLMGLFQGADLTTCSLTLPGSGTMRSGAVSPQATLAQAISASAFSSWHGTPDTVRELFESWPTPNTFPEAPNNSTNRGNGVHRNRDTSQCLGDRAKTWPTARAEDSESCGNHPGAMDSLTGVVKHWPTPSTAPDAPNTNSNQVNGFTSLTEAAQWATPKSVYGGPDFAKADRSTTGDNLPTQVAQWPTPAARDEKGTNNLPFAERGGGTRGEQLPNFVAHSWQTPATDSFRCRGGDRKDEMGLDQQARAATWQTPRSHEAGDYQYDRGDKDSPRETLSGQSQTFAPVQETPPPGTESSKSPPSSRRQLNPIFVCYLMGWPVGWSSVKINSASAAMESYQSWLRRHSSYLRRVLSNSRL
jgi:hypothetical protein